MRKLLLLRPGPGLSASAERAQAMGLDIVRCPLFQVEQVEWDAPDPAGYEALLMTSANAVRHGGPHLASLASLPVHAVGEATASAARDAGFDLALVGKRDIVDLLARIPPAVRLLHLAGEDHRDIMDGRIDQKIVYRSKAIADPPLPPLTDLVVAVHSSRAARRLAELASDRSSTAIAAISRDAADACGSGWERVEAAAEPNDNSLLALAAMLCHTSPPE